MISNSLSPGGEGWGEGEGYGTQPQSTELGKTFPLTPGPSPPGERGEGVTRMSDEPNNPDAPAEVSRFEYNLLSIARFLLGHGNPDQAARWLTQTFTPAPQCLTRTCVNLLQDILSKGIVMELVHAGGWRNERLPTQRATDIGAKLGTLTIGGTDA